VKRIVIALLGGGAAVALTLGMGAAVASASTASAARPANTGSCGPQCVDITFLASGSHWTQVDYYGRTAANTAINLQARTNTNSGEDWYPTGEGKVEPTYCASASQAAVNSILTNNQCELLANADLDEATAFQEQFEPLGVPTNMCAGTVNGDEGEAPVNGDRLRLQGCGENADTLWIADAPGGNNNYYNGPNSFGTPYINGASNNYADPLVVTEVSGAPKYQQLQVQYLDVDSSHVVSDRQLVRLIPGS